MLAIAPTIKPDDSGPQVRNLYAALRFLIDGGVFASLDPSELAKLSDQLSSEQPSGYFQEAAVALVQQFQRQEGLVDDGIVEAETADALNRRLKALGQVYEVEPVDGVNLEYYKVSGTVFDTAGLPQPGLKVVAYDRDLRRHQWLGDASTDAEGRYEISYKHESFLRAEGTVPLAADLFVVVLLDDGLEPLVTSDTRFNAKPVELIDVVVPTTDIKTSEFERVTALVMPLLVGQGTPREVLTSAAEQIPSNLQPYELNAEDLEFIVRETGLDWAAVQAWAESARWTKDALRLLESDADPHLAAAIGSTGWAFIYCVLRDLVVSDLDGILARGMATWESQQTLGEELRRIPVLEAVQRKQLMEALLLLARLVRIDWRRPSPTALARVLADAPLSTPVALHALDIFDEHGIEQPDSYQVLREVYPDDKEPIGRFIQALRLRAATGPDPRFARAVGRELGDVPDPLVSLAAWNVDRWLKVVTELGSDTGPLEPEAAHSRAIEYQLRVERMLPLPAMKARLADIGDSLHDPVLAKLEPMLDKFSEQAHSLLQGQPAVIGPAGPMPTEAAAVVQNLGRFLGLGLTLQGGLGLIDNGIPSPGAAMTYGPDVLKQILFDQFPLTIITSLTRDIQLTANAANGFVHNIITDWHSGYWFGTSGGTPVTPQAAENSPTLQGLFGNLDDCACRPCESVLSLSAYLVDLLNLLKTVPKTGTTGTALQTAQSELRARRPDIFRLDLGCEAAEAEVLHIDLAIGVMEAELGTEPAQQLASAPYPWSLPFDRGFAELQPTSARLGLARSSLLALMTSPSAADVAAATLGIAQTQSGATLSEWLLITTPRSGNDLADSWGVPPGATTTITDPDSGAAITGSLPAVLGRASVLLERTGLELDALDAVLATRYVGGLALYNRQQCKVSEMTLAGQPEAVFDRLHRFTRLARKLPAWSLSLVDSALLACALPSMGRQASHYEAALQTLAAAERARITMNLPAEVVLAMRMPLTSQASGHSWESQMTGVEEELGVHQWQETSEHHC